MYISAQTDEYLGSPSFYEPVRRWEIKAKNILKHKGILILAGDIGEGKTSLCKSLLKQSTAEHKVKLEMNQVKISELKRFSNAQVLLYFEDALGRAQYDQLFFRDKHKILADLIKYIEDENEKNLSVLCCVRSNILENAKQNMTPELKSKIEEITFNISKSDWKLSDSEKRIKLEAFRQKFKDVGVNESEIRTILRITDKDYFWGFFECCALCFESKQGVEIFKKPEELIQKNIERLAGSIEYTILVYMLLKNGPYNLRNLDVQLLLAIGLQAETPSDGTSFEFIRRDTDGKYRFQHQFIKEILLRVYGKSHTDHLIKYADVSVVLDYLRPSSFPITENAEAEVFCVDEKYDRMLAERIVQEMSIRNISNHTASSDPEFISKHLIECIERELILHSNSDANFVETTIDQLLKETNNNGNDELFKQLLHKYIAPLSEDEAVLAVAFRRSFSKFSERSSKLVKLASDEAVVKWIHPSVCNRQQIGEREHVDSLKFCVAQESDKYLAKRLLKINLNYIHKHKDCTYYHEFAKVLVMSLKAVLRKRLQNGIQRNLTSAHVSPYAPRGAKRIGKVTSALDDAIDGIFANAIREKNRQLLQILVENFIIQRESAQDVVSARFNAWLVENCNIVLEYGSDELLKRDVRPSTYKKQNDEKECFLVPPYYDRQLAKRLVQIYKVMYIARHSSMRDQEFVSNHVVIAITEVLVESIKEDDTTDIMESTVDNLLTETKRRSKELYTRLLYGISSRMKAKGFQLHFAQV